MNSEEFQKETNDRLNKLETKNFDGTFHENYKNLSAREHAGHHEDDGQRHFLGIRTYESALQKIESFKSNYDQGSVDALNQAEIKDYKRDLNIANQLAKKWDLPPIPSLMKN